MPLKLYRRGKIWHYRGTVAGRRIRGSAKTSDQAIAARTCAEIEAREWKCNFDGPQSVLMFSQASIMYRAAGKSTRFLDRIEDYWKDTLVKDIKASSIKQMAMILYPDAANATRNRQAIIPCQAVINHAAEAELCPYIRVKRFKVERRIRPPFTLEWLDAFCAHATNPYLSALAIFMFCTGARISEALSAEVNLTAKTALIRATKIGEERLVNLPTRAVIALANLPKVPGRPTFFYRKRGSLHHAWDKTVKLAGIKRMTCHSGRHGFATTILRSGIDPKTGAWLGGWKNIRHFMETYAHAIHDITLNERIFDAKLTQPKAPVARKTRKTGTT
jgi:integrase